MAITIDKILGVPLKHSHKGGDISGVLKTDQSTPQTVTGQPTFDGGIKVINGFIILNE